MKKEFLNEENYQKTRKVLIIFGLIIMSVALLIGGFLIYKGIEKLNANNNTENVLNNKEKLNELYDSKEEILEKIDDRIEKLEEELETLEIAEDKAEQKITTEFFKDSNSDAYYEAKRAKEKITKQKREVESQITDLEGLYLGSDNKETAKLLKEYYDVYNEIADIEIQQKTNTTQNRAIFKAMPFFMFGGFIILVGLLIGGRIISIAYTRHMLAFGTQTVVPVAKEVVDDMTPTISKALGEITKGIKDGIDK